jgi:hypothetical protein
MIQDKIFFDEKDPTGLSYNTPFTVYGSYEGRLWSKTPSGEIKYYTQNSDLSVYATTGSNQFEGAQDVTGSLTVTGSFNLNDSATNFNILGNQFGETYLISNNGNIVLHPIGDSEGIVIVKETDLTVEGDITVNNLYASNGVVSGSSQIVEYNVFATTGSNQFDGSQAITGSLTVTGQVVAQTLNVQQVTSSIVYSSGSNIFGNDLGNTQQFTGSVSVTGSLAVNGIATSGTVSGTTNYIGKFTGATTIGNSTLQEVSGNLGLGVTPSAGWVEGKALEVGFVGTSLWGRYANESHLTMNYYYSTSANARVYASTNPASDYEQFNGNHIWYSAPSGTIGTNVSLTPYMTLSAAGRLLIGKTNDEGFALDVVGTGRIKGASASPTLTLANSTGGTLADFTITENTGLIINSYEGASARSIDFRVANTSSLLISSTGAATFASSVTAGTEFISYSGINMDAGGGTIRGGLTINYSTGEFKSFCGISGNAYFQTFHTNGSERMRITSGGNVLIGTTTDGGAKLRVNGDILIPANDRLYGNSATVTGSRSFIELYNGSTGNITLVTGFSTASIVFGTQGGTERMRITSGGYFKASNDGVYLGGNIHEFLADTANSYTLIVSNKSASPASTYIQDWRFTASTPNNSSARFWNCEDATAQRAHMRSDGGLANFQSNDANLSDERTKKDISPLESYWDKFKDIQIVKFKYKDQTHDDYNIGVIAQQVESVAPEFVDVDGWGEIVEGEEPLKSIYTADLHHATIKVLQEAMAKIESLEAILQRNNIS